MKSKMNFFACFLLFCTTGQLYAQSASESPKSQTSVAAVSPSSQQSVVDPGKAADIRKLLEVSGVKGIMAQTMVSMGDTLRPLMAKALPAGDYRDKLVDLFFAKFQSKADPQQLVELIVPIYDKYLTDEEIKGLIQFYQTPLGQKAVNVLPRIVAESQQRGEKWGEQLGQDSMLEVLSEHPELKKALEEAKGNPSPQ